VIASSVIEEVRRRVDAVAVVRSKLELRESGSSYIGTCPFHEGREESFHLYHREKRFRCHACGAHGDVFELVERLEGRPFGTVVRELASGAGVVVSAEDLSTEEERVRGERKALLSACEAAASAFERNLWGEEGGAARAYLSSRGVSEAVARTFRLGYALPGWHELERSLKDARIPPEVQCAAGLVVAKVEGKGPGSFDRFRDRVVFPLRDARGRIIGFAGRLVRIGPGPTYLGGPETPIFKRNRSLLGLWEAREEIRRTGRAILVEGFFDTVILHQAGFTDAVALGGTSVAREQVELLEESGCREAVLLFDGDEAGARAPSSAAPVFLKAGLTATVASLAAIHARSDPDSFVLSSGTARLQEVLAAARPLTEHLIDEALRRSTGEIREPAAVEHKLAALRDLAPLVLSAPEGIRRNAFEKAVARRLGFDVGPLRLEVRRLEREARRGVP